MNPCVASSMPRTASSLFSMKTATRSTFPISRISTTACQEPIRRSKTCTDLRAAHGATAAVDRDALSGSRSPRRGRVGGPELSFVDGCSVDDSHTDHRRSGGPALPGRRCFLRARSGVLRFRGWAHRSRHRAQESRSHLHASQELYTNVVESMNEGVLVLDRDFRFISWNRAMESSEPHFA